MAIENSFSIDFPQELTLFSPFFSQSLIYTSSSPLPSPFFGQPEPACNYTEWQMVESGSCQKARQFSSSTSELPQHKRPSGQEVGCVLLTLRLMQEHLPTFLYSFAYPVWAEAKQGRPECWIHVELLCQKETRSITPRIREFILKGIFSVLYLKFISLLLIVIGFLVIGCVVFFMNTFITTPAHQLLDCI